MPNGNRYYCKNVERDVGIDSKYCNEELGPDLAMIKQMAATALLVRYMAAITNICTLVSWHIIS